jgi:hypothetical protein
MIEPEHAIHVIAESIGRDARRLLVERVVTAWVDAIPEHELVQHYAKALAGLDADKLDELASWRRPGQTAQASREDLVRAFPALGERRREALQVAARVRGTAAFDAGVTEQRILATVLPHLPRERLDELARACIELYLGDRLGGTN